jgi:hypothetical protein
MKKVRALPKKTYDELWFNLTNANHEWKDGQTGMDKAMQIIKDNGLTAEFKKVQEVLSDIEARAEKSGFIISKLKNYFPRNVRDYAGYMEFLNEEAKNPENQHLRNFLNSANERARLAGLSEEEAQNLVLQHIMKGNMPGITQPGSTKLRSIGQVSSRAMGFYSNLEDAITSHIYEMNDKIEQRAIVGGGLTRDRVEAAKAVRKIEQQIEKVGLHTKLNDPDMLEGLTKKWAAAHKVLDSFGTMDEEITESVSAMLKEDTDLSDSERHKVALLFNARFKQRGTRGWVRSMKNVGLMTTLGNPLAAITQIGDLALLLYRYGNIFKGQLGAYKGIFKALGTMDLIKEFDFDGHLREWSENAGTAKGLDFLLKYSGLKGIDLFAKEAFLRSAWEEHANMSLEQFREKWAPTGALTDIDAAWQIFKDGKLEKDSDGNTVGAGSQDALYVIYSELADFQPINLSETPPGYQEGGNLRIAYMLKTFAIKQVNTILREANEEFKQGNHAKGVLKAGTLILLLSMVGAGADEIKDMILGRKKDFPDHVLDNMLMLGFMNRYQFARPDQFVKGWLSGFLPPVGYLEDAIKDTNAFINGDPVGKIWKDVPLGGRLIYDRFTTVGKLAEIVRQREAIYDDIRDGDTDWDKIRDLNKLIREIPKEARENKVSVITRSTVRSLLRAEAEE